MKGAEIFATGTHNSVAFTTDDLDAMVASFDALGLSGRVPLKVGHSGFDPRDDGKPALGWVTRVWRSGQKLLADVADIPKQVADAIAANAYKYCSVELLQDMKAGTHKLPWVLDAVALLGVSAPAVGDLAPLRESLSMRRRYEFKARHQFTHALGGNPSMTDLTNEQLQNEIQTLRRQLVAANLEGAINAGRCQPNARVLFSRQYGADATLEDLTEFLKTAPKPPKGGVTSRTNVDADPADTNERADATLLRMARARVKAAKKDGDDLTMDAAVKLVMKEDPTLARRWQMLPEA
ncbi:MAG: hypothetical protein JSR73_12170 [Proteobacteria bacterium]|nr:hypothetical protein [Pseudomonadota bacterium]